MSRHSRQLPFPGGSFDTNLFNAVLEHVEHACSRNFRRDTKDGLNALGNEAALAALMADRHQG
ncbi:MAG TPA: hypothetical protein VGB79_04500 [Allosphingosinicella sp.]